MGGPDILSDLPLNVLETILLRLPLKEAIKTSVLSTKWRYKWTTIPHLIIDDQCISCNSNNFERMKYKLVNFVDRLLLLHRGPIQKFKLSVSFLLSCPDIDQWILYLSRHDVKEFILELEEKEWYKAPAALFNCEYLTHLELHRCEMLPPPTFRGFRSLKHLTLQQAFFESDDIENLIANCPILESFTLAYFDTLSIKIRAPRLKYLRLEGEFKDIVIEEAPILASISIALYMTDEIAEHLDVPTTWNMKKALGSVPLVEKLVAESYFVKYLSVGHLPRGLPVRYDHLKQIELFQVGFEDVNEISVAISLLIASPNLEQLHISASSDIEACVVSSDMEFWEKRHPLDVSFNRLQTVKMTDISGVTNELEFIKFVLAKSPVLRAVTIKPSVYVIEGGWDMLIEMLQFPRASTQAGITYIQS